MTLIKTFDQVLDSLEPLVRRRCLHYLRSICVRQALLPRSLAIPLCYDPKENPLYDGGYVGVWEGQYRGQKVAAKVFGVYSMNDVGRIRKVGCSQLGACR